MFRLLKEEGQPLFVTQIVDPMSPHQMPQMLEEYTIVPNARHSNFSPLIFTNNNDTVTSSMRVLQQSFVAENREKDVRQMAEIAPKTRTSAVGRNASEQFFTTTNGQIASRVPQDAIEAVRKAVLQQKAVPQEQGKSGVSNETFITAKRAILQRNGQLMPLPPIQTQTFLKRRVPYQNRYCEKRRRLELEALKRQTKLNELISDQNVMHDFACMNLKTISRICESSDLCNNGLPELLSSLSNYLPNLPISDLLKR